MYHMYCIIVLKLNVSPVRQYPYRMSPNNQIKLHKDPHEKVPW